MRLFLGGFLAGVIAAYFFSWTPIVSLLFLAISVVASVRYLCTRTRHVWGVMSIISLAVGSAVFLTTYSHVRYELRQEKVLSCNSSCHFTGMVVSRAQTGARSASYEVKLLTINSIVVEHIFIQIATSRADRFSYGDTLSFVGEPQPFEAFLSDTGTLVPYDMLMRARHIHAHVDVREVSRMGRVSSFTALSMHSTDAFARVLDVSLAEPYAGLGKGIAFGVAHVLDDNTETLFRTTGLSHITVFSGANVALILALVWFLSRHFPFGVRIVISFLSLLFVIAGVGFTPPTLRAGIMGALYILARAVGKSTKAFDALCFTVLCMLMYEPLLLLFDISFQLSVLAVIALVLFSQPFEMYFGRYMPSYVAELCATACAITLVVSPWIAYIFGTFSVSSFVTNICVAPLIPIALVLTLATSFVGITVPYLAWVVALPAEIVLRGIYDVAYFGAKIPYSSIQLHQFHGAFVALWYGALSVLVLRHRQSSEIVTE